MGPGFRPAMVSAVEEAEVSLDVTRVSLPFGSSGWQATGFGLLLTFLTVCFPYNRRYWDSWILRTRR